MTKDIITTTQVPATVLKLADVFSYPEYTARGLGTWEDVAATGSKNIAALISSARGNEKSLTDQIAHLKEQESVLRGKSGDDFVEAAKSFQNPNFPEIGEREGNWSHDPEPLDEESKVRERDTTTFNVCGWCKYASGGSCRYSYYITTHCGLLGGYSASPESQFNTPCLLTSKTAEEIEAQVDRMEMEVESLLVQREKVRQGIKLLQRLKKNAPEKPYLMSLRPHDHFNVGDDVMVYVGQWKQEDGGCRMLVKDGVWVPAIVAYGYRHHDGCVSYQTLFPIHNNMSNDNGCGGGAGMSRPEVLLRSEFNYLRDAWDTDQHFLGLWIANIDNHLRGLDSVTFWQDLSSLGKIANPPADWQPPTDDIPVKTVKDAERILQMLDFKLFKSREEIRAWANMQLNHIHPDRLNGASENVKAYAARQTRAVYAARDLLVAEFGRK